MYIMNGHHCISVWRRRRRIASRPFVPMNKLAEVQLECTHLRYHVPLREKKVAPQVTRHPEEEPVLVVNICCHKPVSVQSYMISDIVVRRATWREKCFEQRHGVICIVGED